MAVLGLGPGLGGGVRPIWALAGGGRLASLLPRPPPPRLPNYVVDRKTELQPFFQLPQYFLEPTQQLRSFLTSLSLPLEAEAWVQGHISGFAWREKGFTPDRGRLCQDVFLKVKVKLSGDQGSWT